MTVHRTLDGGWAECSGCALKFHFEDLTVAAAETMPFNVLLPLLNEIDPPQEDIEGLRSWFFYAADGTRMLHRDYDLPAMISIKGSMHWYSNGVSHRTGNRPAVIDYKGTREWMLSGQALRTDGGPVLVYHDGTEYWADSTGALVPERPEGLAKSS